MGLDNMYYYTVVLPAVAILLGDDKLLPDTMVTNQFLHLDAAKFSTSRRHAVWADESLALNSADTVRAALLREAPEGRVTSISDERARGRITDQLAVAVEEWQAGLEKLAASIGNVVPGTGAWTPTHREVYRFLNSVTEQADGVLLPGAFNGRAYVRLLDTLVERLREFAAADAAMRGDADQAEETRTSEALQFLCAKVVAALVWPIMSAAAAGIWSWLGLSGVPVREVSWSFLPGGTRCEYHDQD
ncbi:class I tRNA ligase family protein [Couchioplanes caeruleus]|uniref:tRNA synthetase class I (M) n=1 Tax=Couchioplanes caeruleus TaxID=56438 RepID=A0A3N1GPK5_9ACTN|nr:class I tRNA ligase family protein [Couchioplanes caeruleus]ROP32165.1 tRNA synthetase class I (M) [Couchioplanes caeruleus]